MDSSWIVQNRRIFTNFFETQWHVKNGNERYRVKIILCWITVFSGSIIGYRRLRVVVRCIQERGGGFCRCRIHYILPISDRFVHISCQRTWKCTLRWHTLFAKRIIINHHLWPPPKTSKSNLTKKKFQNYFVRKIRKNAVVLH